MTIHAVISRNARNARDGSRPLSLFDNTNR
jgi:hypothetical protein